VFLRNESENAPQEGTPSDRVSGRRKSDARPDGHVTTSSRSRRRGDQERIGLVVFFDWGPRLKEHRETPRRGVFGQ